MLESHSRALKMWILA